MTTYTHAHESYTLTATVLHKRRGEGGVKGQRLTESSISLNEEDGKQIEKKGEQEKDRQGRGQEDIEKERRGKRSDR